MKNFSKTQFFYVRMSPKATPVACVAWRLEHPGGKEKVLSCATSTRNPADAFDRKRARQIAEGRLNRRPEYVGPTGADTRDEIRNTICTLLINGGTNARIRRGARAMVQAVWDETARQVQEDLKHSNAVDDIYDPAARAMAIRGFV